MDPEPVHEHSSPAMGRVIVNTRIYYGPDHRYWWVTELAVPPAVGIVIGLDIAGTTHRYRVQRAKLIGASSETDAIDHLHVWTKEIDIPGEWIPIPDRGQYAGDERFYKIIPRHIWAGLSRGDDYQPYCPIAHREIYRPPSVLGTWSGDRDKDGSYLDSPLHDDSPICPL